MMPTLIIRVGWALDQKSNKAAKRLLASYQVFSITCKITCKILTKGLKDRNHVGVFLLEYFL